MGHHGVHLLAVAIGGAAGAVLRYLVAVRLFGVASLPAWPWATFSVNVAGSLLFGFLAVALASSHALSENMRLALMTGLLGAFTTYSTFAFEVVRLLQARAYALALGYGFGTLVCCVLVAAAGLWLGRLLFE